jgi:carbonic anhydrase
VSRGALLRTAGLLAFGLLAGNGTAPQRVAASAPTKADAAWAALRAGNRRWVAGRLSHPHQEPQRRAEVARDQDPFAVVLSCIDSRVPPEIVFDTGIGDLMVIRTAGQTINPLVSGAIEFGPVELGTPLIVVLGHQRCGAVQAAASALSGGEMPPGDLRWIVEALRPAYLRSGGDAEKMSRLNVAYLVRRLREDPLLAPRIARGRLKVIGAHYSLDTGRVTRLV